ncbi:MAG: hypothetical protein K1Y36_12950 [Blastocatellia bacterium]|nr:hypothetical protein [Blastocatellia bacterium]
MKRPRYRFVLIWVMAVVLSFCGIQTRLAEAKQVPVPNAQTQTGKERRFSRIGFPQEPAEVLSFNASGDVIPLSGKPFAAGDDWLQGLSLQLKNTSRQAIQYAEIALSVPGSQPGLVAPNSQMARTVLLTFGKLSAADDVAPVPPLLSGQSATLHFTPDQYASFQLMLEESGLHSPIHHAQVNVRGILFTDNTVWMGGKSFYPASDGISWLEKARSGVPQREVAKAAYSVSPGNEFAPRGACGAYIGVTRRTKCTGAQCSPRNVSYLAPLIDRTVSGSYTTKFEYTACSGCTGQIWEILDFCSLPE